GRPIALETRVEQGDSQTLATAKFAANIADITYQKSTEPEPHRMRLDFSRGAALGPGASVHDAHSAMAQLRGWHATPGTRRTVFVVGGRRLWRIDVTYAGQDTIGSAIGNRRAIRFAGESYRARRLLARDAAADPHVQRLAQRRRRSRAAQGRRQDRA